MGTREGRFTRGRAGALATALLLASMLALGGCASSGGSGSAYPDGYSAPPEGSALAKVKEGMSDEEVRKILGPPDDTNSYTTGKAWIPFYYGPDTSRTDWHYRGQGRVVFSRNRYSGGLKVIRSMHNPQE